MTINHGINGRSLSPIQEEELLTTLKKRFAENMERHPEMEWPLVQERLKKHPEILWSLLQMEQTGGEPDVVGSLSENNTLVFYDCSPETPSGRRSCCYDQKALAARKKNKPKSSALQMAEVMRIQLLDEEQYRFLQEFGEFDTKTSSWIHTPQSIREKGGALFCDRRYDQVFVYHNSAESYYASRGFRGYLSI